MKAKEMLQRLKAEEAQLEAMVAKNRSTLKEATTALNRTQGAIAILEKLSQKQ